MEEIVKKAHQFNLDEIEKYHAGYNLIYDLALEKGILLAQKYQADEKVIRIAIAMMDSKLPEASFLKKAPEHIKMGIEATRKLLDNDESLTSKQKENIIKCVEEHHGVKKFYSIESEIVCNADCYKFLHPKGVLSYHAILGRRLNDYYLELTQLEKKMDEKYNAISLNIVKDELDEYYKAFKNYLKEAKKGE